MRPTEELELTWLRWQTSTQCFSLSVWCWQLQPLPSCLQVVPWPLHRQLDTALSQQNLPNGATQALRSAINYVFVCRQIEVSLVTPFTFLSMTVTPTFHTDSVYWVRPMVDVDVSQNLSTTTIVCIATSNNRQQGEFTHHSDFQRKCSWTGQISDPFHPNRYRNCHGRKFCNSDIYQASTSRRMDYTENTVDPTIQTQTNTNRSNHMVVLWKWSIKRSAERYDVISDWLHQCTIPLTCSDIP